MHDAVTLANWFSTLRMAREKDILNVFKEYRAERLPVVKDAFKSSQMLTKNLGKVIKLELRVISRFLLFQARTNI